MESDNKQFFEIGSYTGSLREGHEICVQRTVTYRGQYADFKPLLEIPQEELEKRLESSKAEEKKVYDALQKAAQAWDEHGAQTLLLKRAIEYLQVPKVQHTGNQWEQRKDGTWEISNLVYRMTYSIEKAGDEWKLSWELEYTSPGYKTHSYYSYYDDRPKPRIEREGSKKYKTLEGAQKYIQSKYDEYAYLFMEISPPIPQEAKTLFCVNGQLLQGYTMAPKERDRQEIADDLLGLLDDSDLIAPAAIPIKSPEPPASAAKAKKGVPKKDLTPKKKQPTPAR